MRMQGSVPQDEQTLTLIKTVFTLDRCWLSYNSPMNTQLHSISEVEGNPDLLWSSPLTLLKGKLNHREETWPSMCYVSSNALACLSGTGARKLSMTPPGSPGKQMPKLVWHVVKEVEGT